jgi:flagellar basal-body rod modification protein FlgD
MISGISSLDPISLSSSEAEKSALGKDSFMELLVTQMKNQDPLNPAKNEEMLAQLAQFSSLEQMEELNANIVGLAVLQQSNALMSQLTDSSALIGKSVRYADPITGAEQWGTVDSVRLQEGVAVLRIDGKDVPLLNITEVGDEPTPTTPPAGETEQPFSTPL